MHYPQVLIYERDGRLAELLKAGLVARAKKWAVREPRDPAACLRLLERGGPAVVVIKLGRDLEGELKLLENVEQVNRETRAILVGDAEHVGLAGIGWHFGAAYVLLPPMSRESLAEIVVGLMGKE